MNASSNHAAVNKRAGHRSRPISTGGGRGGRSARSDLATLVDQLTRNSETAIAARRAKSTTPPDAIDLTDGGRSPAVRAAGAASTYPTTIDLRSADEQRIDNVDDERRPGSTTARTTPGPAATTRSPSPDNITSRFDGYTRPRPRTRAVSVEFGKVGLFDLSGNQKAYSSVSSDMESNWMTLGNCSNHPPETFFPSDGVGVEVAKKICADCPSQEPCLEYALAHRIDHGVWGGTSERQRRRILKARKEARAIISGTSR